MIKCTTCIAGDMEQGHTTVTFTKDERVTVFRHVPALVCDSCGDYSLTMETTSLLLLDAKVAEQRGVQLEIVDWQVTA